MLGDKLTKISIKVNHASGDADLIVQTALKAAKAYPTVLIGEDTDLLVLVLHYFMNEKSLYFTYERKQNQQRAEVWNIDHAKQILGKICNDILVIYAFSGYDKTSRIHSEGKPAVRKIEKYQKSNEFQKLTTIFLDPSVNKEKTMDEKRLANYYKELEGKSAVKPESLGPNSDGTAKHSERVYHTVQSWCGNDLPPERWRWKMLNRMCLPV